MKLALLLSRHRRLLALCGLSAAAHLLVLELAARRGAIPPAAPPVGDALRLRLAPAGAPVAARIAQEPVTHAAKPTPQAEPTRAATRAAAPATMPAPTPPPAVPGVAANVPADAAGAPLVQMPSRYRVRMPESVRLSYALTRQAPGPDAAPVATGSASIDWRSDGEHYMLAVDGVAGRLRSEGGSSDAGIAPARAGEDPANATQGGAVQLSDFAEHAVGAQDRASVLMQLAGIGLAEPDQIAGQIGNEIRIVVAGADGAGIERYQVMGREQVPTALGDVAAWRLAQAAQPGRDRLELWLAPDRGWLPVQLRLTRPDGSAVTQTLTRIEPGDPGKPQ